MQEGAHTSNVPDESPIYPIICLDHEVDTCELGRLHRCTTRAGWTDSQIRYKRGAQKVYEQTEEILSVRCSQGKRCVGVPPSSNQAQVTVLSLICWPLSPSRDEILGWSFRLRKGLSL